MHMPLVGSAFLSAATHFRTFAYLDPGTGSFLIQMIVGGLLGALFLVKVYWKKIITWIRKAFTHEKKAETSQD